MLGIFMKLFKKTGICVGEVLHSGWYLKKERRKEGKEKNQKSEGRK